MNRRDSIKWMTMVSVGMINSNFMSIINTAMNTRKIPVSSESLPVVGVGTWQTFDVGNSEVECDPLKKILKLLIEKGGSVIDSSPMYGRSEKVVVKL